MARIVFLHGFSDYYSVHAAPIFWTDSRCGRQL